MIGYDDHNHDNIDLPFVSDEKLIGKWESVAFVSEKEDFLLKTSMMICI